MAAPGRPGLAPVHNEPGSVAGTAEVGSSHRGRMMFTKVDKYSTPEKLFVDLSPQKDKSKMIPHFLLPNMSKEKACGPSFFHSGAV